jgi:hypothetical protein
VLLDLKVNLVEYSAPSPCQGTCLGELSSESRSPLPSFILAAFQYVRIFRT